MLRTAERSTEGTDVGTIQNSVTVVPSFNWYCTVYDVPTGVAPTFGSRLMLTTPFTTEYKMNPA